MLNLNNIATEKINPATADIDTLSTLKMLEKINTEDQKVAIAVQVILPQIAQVVDEITLRLKNGGRLFYIGAGTSGRLGILDASECPPTFGVSPELVQGIIAGGHQAILKAVEGAEDSTTLGAQDLAQAKFSNKDVLVGIAASGRTPYTKAALEYANSLDALTVALVSSPNSPMSEVADYSLCVEPGPEVITGSTRLKAGTAQKLVLNMLSTGTMIKLGKVYHNFMVDLTATNHKLQERSINIVMQVTDATRSEAINALQEARQNTKLAIFLLISHKPVAEAEHLLNQAQGYISEAIKLLN